MADDLAGYGVKLTLDLAGASEATRQAERLGAAIDKIYAKTDKPINFTVKTKDFDWDSLFAKAENRLNQLKDQMRKLGADIRLPANLREQLAELFPTDKADAFFAKVNQEYRDTGKIGGQVASDILKAYKGMFSQLVTAQKAWADKTKDPALRNELVRVAKDAEKAFGQMTGNAISDLARLGRTGVAVSNKIRNQLALLRDGKVNSDKAYDTLDKSLLNLSNARYSASQTKATQLDLKQAEKVAEIQQKAAEEAQKLADINKVVNATLQEQSEKERKLTEEIERKEAAERAFREELQQQIVMLQTMGSYAGLLTGSFQKVASEGVVALKTSLNDTQRELRGLIADSNVFRELFGKNMAERVEKVRSAMANVKTATMELSKYTNATDPESGAKLHPYMDSTVIELTKNVNTANQQLLQAQKELSNNVLRTTVEANDKLQARIGLANEFLVTELRASQAETQRKEIIMQMMSEIKGGRSVIENQRRLQQQIVDIVRDNGNMESAIIDKKLRELNIDKQRLEYAQRLISASKELASGTKPSSTREGQFALASEAYGAYRDAAITTSSRDTMRTALNGMKEAGEIMARMSAQNTFRDTISQVIASINSGLVPAYDKVTAAAQKYANVNNTAFANDASSIEMIKRAVAALNKQYSDISASGGNMAQREQIVRMMQELRNISASGTTQPAQELAAKIGEAVAKQEQKLSRDKEELAARQRINAEMDKLIGLQQIGVNSVGNYKKLLDAVIEANRKNISIEESLFAKLHDKSQLVDNIRNEIVATNAATRLVAFSEQSSLTILERKRDLYMSLRNAMASMSNATTVNLPDVKTNKDTTMNRKAIEQQIAFLNKQIESQKRVIANEEAYTRRVTENIRQAQERANAEQKVVDICTRAVQAISEEKLQYDQLQAAAKAYVSSILSGKDARSLGLDMYKAEEVALKNLVSAESNLLRILDDEKEAMSVRVQAAQRLQEVEQRISQILASNKSRDVTIGNTTRQVTTDKSQETYTKATNFLADNTTKLTREAQNAEQKFLKINEAIKAADAALKDTVVSQRMVAKLENDYAVSIKQSLEYILAGVEPYKHYVNLLNQINAAASSGLTIDKESLAIASKKQQVLQAIATQINNSLLNGAQSTDPLQAASIVKANRPRVDMLKETGFDPAEIARMEKMLTDLETKAGHHLADSMAAAQKKVEDTYKSVDKMFAGLQKAVTEANKNGTAAEQLAGQYTVNLSVVNRIVEALHKVQQAEKGVLNNADALSKLTGDDLIKQQQRINTIERLEAAYRRMGQAQQSATENLTKVGKGYTIENAMSSQGVSEMGKDATATKTSRYYVRAVEDINKFKQAVTEVNTILNGMSSAERASFGNLTSSMQQMTSVANKAATEMNRIAEAQKRLSQNDAGASIFDKFRVYWFMQLRAFWEMYTNIGQLIQTIVQYNQTLKTMQAVTQGTTRDIDTMTASFANLTAQVPLALASVSKAALEVAKAGYGVNDTLKIIQSASKLAVATQSEIATVADLQAVILHAWHYDVNEVDKISNQLFNAVSKSRADINGLASAIGYISGIAPQANVPLDQALSIMSILTNAGFTMSKAGTYTRQFLNDLMNPSAKLQNIVSGLGLSLSDIDPRLNSLDQIFRTLSASGMNVADAFEGMSIRAASAFSVMLKNSQYISKFTDEINEVGSVDTAFETASETTAAAWQLLINAIVNFGQTLAEISGDSAQAFLHILTDIVNGINSFFSLIERNPYLKTFISSLLKGITVLLAFKYGIIGVTKAFAVFKGLVTVLGGLVTSLIAVGTSATTAAGGVGLLKGALTSLTAVNPILLGLTAALYALYQVYESFVSENAKVAESMERMKTLSEDLKKATQDGFKINISYEEAKAIGGSLTLAEQNVQQNSALENPYQKNQVRQSMQNVASLLRSSENADLQKLGDEVTKFIPAPDESIEKYQSAIEQLSDVLSRSRNVISEQQSALRDWAQNTSKLVSDAANSIITNTTAIEAKLKQATTKHLSPELYGKGDLSDAASTDRRKLASLETRILGSMSSRGAGSSDLLSAAKGFIGGVTADTKDFSSYISDINNTMKELGMALTGDENRRLAEAKTVEEFKNTVQEILSIYDKKLFESGRGNFSPKEYEAFIPNIKAAHNAMVVLLKTQVATEEEFANGKASAEAFFRVIEQIKKTGLINDPQLSGMATQWERLTQNYQKWVKESQASIAKFNVSTTEDPNAPTVQSRKDAIKKEADAAKNAIKELTAMTGSAGKADAFMNLLGVQDIEGAMRERLNSALEKFGDVVALFQNKGADLAKTLNAEEISKATSALKELIPALMQSASGANELEKFENAYQSISEAVKKQGAPFPVDIKSLAKAVNLSKTLADEFQRDAQQDPFMTLGQNQDRLQSAMAQMVKANNMGLLDNATVAGMNKTYLSAQKGIISLNSEMAKSLASSNRSITAFKVAVSGLSDISFDAKDITAASVAMDKLAESSDEAVARIDAVREASEDAESVLKAYHAQMQALGNTPDGSVMSLQVLRDTADGLRKNLDTVTQQAKAMKDSLAAAKKEMLGIKLSAANDMLGFAQKYNSAIRKQSWRPDDSFLASQENINLQRQMLSMNMQYMEVGEVISNLGNIRDAIVAQAENFPMQPRAQQELAKSLNINTLIQDLYKAQYEQKEAEAAVIKARWDSMLSLSEQMLSQLTTIANILGERRQETANIPVTPLPAIGRPERVSRYPVGNDEGALSRKYESGGRNSNAIGYDPRGGTSYGTYQIASAVGTMDSFIKYLQAHDTELATELTRIAKDETIKQTNDVNASVKWNAGNRRDTEPGAIAWKTVALRYGERFEKAQADFIGATHYTPALETYLKASGQALEDVSMAVKQALYSTGVQHGASGQRNLVQTAAITAKTANGGIDEEKFLRVLYAQRAKAMPSTASRYTDELADALAKLKSGSSPDVAKQQQQAQSAALKEAEALEAASKELRAAQEAYDKMRESMQTTPQDGTSVGGKVATAALDPQAMQDGWKKVEEAQKKYFAALAAWFDKSTSAALAQSGGKTPVRARVPAPAPFSAPVTRAATVAAQSTRATTATVNKGAEAQTAYAKATEKLNMATKTATEKAQLAAKYGSKLADVQQSQDVNWTGENGVADLYLAGWEGNAMEYSRELFTNEVNAMKQGLTNVLTTSVRDAINGTSDWEDAAWDMIYNMIDSWISGLMNNLVNSIIASTMKGTAANSWGWLGFGNEGASMGAATGAIGMGGAHTGGLVGVISRHKGGIAAFAAGGMVTHGNRQADSTLAMLTKGEYVIQEPTVRKYGVDFMRTLNEGSIGDVQKALGDFGITQDYKTQSFTGTDSQGRTTGSGAGGMNTAGGRRDRQSMNIVNVSDPQDVGRYLATSRGERQVLNIMNKNTRRSRGNF